jgi:hypothetical protein
VKTSLRIPLLDIVQYPVPAVDTQTSKPVIEVLQASTDLMNGTSNADVQPSEPVTLTPQLPTGPVSETSSVSIEKSPFSLTDAEVGDILKNLEETFSPEEVDKLLGGLEAGLDESELLSDHYIDNEVRRSMNMFVEDFIV